MATSTRESRFFFWTFVAFCLFVAYLLVVKEPWLVQSMEKERRGNYALLGAANAKAAEVRAHNAYTSMFINTGLIAKAYDLFVPTSGPQDAVAAELEVKAEPVMSWLETRVRSFFLVMYQILVRGSTALVWWPFLVLTVIPFVVDAMVRRKVKSTSFQYTSPHLHAFGARGFVLLLLGYPVMLLLPVAIPAPLLPAMIFLIAGAIWFAISHFTKRA